MQLKLRLSGVNIVANVEFDSTREYCLDYLSDFECADVTLSVTIDDLRAERDKYHADCRRDGTEPKNLSRAYFETLALYRKICDALIDFNILLLHGSSLAVDGRGFLFTARSGVGKSTHARIYRERFGERVEMINDDKPLISVTDNGAFIHGTPWDGKHRLSANITRPLSAICILKRGAENRIERVSLLNALPDIIAQTHIPRDKEKTERVLNLLDKLVHNVKLYRLECNTDPSSVETSYEAMREIKNED